MTGLLAILLLSFLVERILQQIKPLVPAPSRRKVLPIVGMVLGLLLSFATRMGILTRLGLLAEPGVGWRFFLDLVVTGLLIGGGSEPIHALISLIQHRKERLPETK